MRFSKKDLLSSIITGIETGFIAWRIAGFLGQGEFYNISLAWLIIVVPGLWILGVNFGYLLGRFMNFFNQFGRFVAVGFTNAAVDFGVLYVFIAFTGHTAGYYYAAFKFVSFLVANVHSYFWNKHWVFEAGKMRGGKQEIVKFAAVTVGAAMINVIAAAIVVNTISPLFGILPTAWAGVGAAVGSATALVFSFLGFRLAVFKK